MRSGTAGRPASSTRCCAGSSARAGTTGSPSFPSGPRRCAALALQTAHPDWIVEAFAAALDGDLRRDRGRAARRRRAAAYPPGGLAGPDHPHRAARRRRRRRRPVLAVRGPDVRRRPGRARGRPRSRRAARPGRGEPAVRARARGRPARRPRRALARPVRRPGRQGGAAGRARRRARGHLARQRAAPAPRGARPARHRAVGHRGDRRATRANCPVRTAATTGCCSTRRAPGWARCAAARRCAGDAARTTSPQLAALQRDLLAAALRLTRPGGVVAYVTCSPHPAETREIVAGHRPARRPAAVPRRPQARRRPDGPAVAAPARHGRDVLRRPAPRLTGRQGPPRTTGGRLGQDVARDGHNRELPAGWFDRTGPAADRHLRRGDGRRRCPALRGRRGTSRRSSWPGWRWPRWRAWSAAASRRSATGSGAGMTGVVQSALRQPAGAVRRAVLPARPPLRGGARGHRRVHPRQRAARARPRVPRRRAQARRAEVQHRHREADQPDPAARRSPRCSSPGAHRAPAHPGPRPRARALGDRLDRAARAVRRLAARHAEADAGGEGRRGRGDRGARTGMDARLSPSGCSRCPAPRPRSSPTGSSPG